jgi:hypothetical protein
MIEIDETSDIKKSIGLQLGPLYYHFLAYDEWGVDVLERISLHLTCRNIQGKPDRIIHLTRKLENYPEGKMKVSFPVRLWQHLNVQQRLTDWQQHSSRLDTVWFTTQSVHTFWKAEAEPAIGPVRFHLPWGLIIDDIINRGGGLVHGGLASFNDSGLLFLAPPGGGKSTTLSTAPVSWQVLSDDAALIWPGDNKEWHASALPAWGSIINPEMEWSYPLMNLACCCRLKGLMLLEKASGIQLQPTSPVDIVANLYRSLNEYPAAIMGSRKQWEPLFRMAAQMTRDLSGWTLSLPRHGDVWPLLIKEAV